MVEQFIDGLGYDVVCRNPIRMPAAKDSILYAGQRIGRSLLEPFEESRGVVCGLSESVPLDLTWFAVQICSSVEYM